jgi:hypothetical protein
MAMDAPQGLPPVPSLPTAPFPVAVASESSALTSTSVVERSSQERTHFNVAESALPAALADSALVAAQHQTALTSKAAEPHSRAALRRHPALWFLAGSLCTLLLVLLFRSQSGESARASESATSAAVVPARSPAESVTSKVATPSVESAAPAAPAPAPGEAETAVVAQADPADETTDKDPVTANSVEPPADGAKAAAPAARTPKRHRYRPRKKTSFIPKGL